MEIDIRKNIIKNFKGALKDEIKASIVESINTGEEVTLPGLGTFFEILWKNSSIDEQDFILKTLENNLK